MQYSPDSLWFRHLDSLFGHVPYVQVLQPDGKHWTDYVNAFSTIAVAAFAAVELWRGRRESRWRRMAVDARLSAEANGQLDNVVSIGTAVTTIAGSRLEPGGIQGIQERLQQLEQVLFDMAARTPDASAAVAQAVEHAVALHARAKAAVADAAIKMQRGEVQPAIAHLKNAVDPLVGLEERLTSVLSPHLRGERNRAGYRAGLVEVELGRHILKGRRGPPWWNRLRIWRRY